MHYYDQYTPSVSLRQLDNLKAGNDGVMGEGGVLVTKEKMIDDDTAKVDVNAKADAPNASNTSGVSNIDTHKIHVKIGIGKPCTVAIGLSWCVSLEQQALCDTHSSGEGIETGEFDAPIDEKK